MMTICINIFCHDRSEKLFNMDNKTMLILDTYTLTALNVDRISNLYRYVVQSTGIAQNKRLTKQCNN